MTGKTEKILTISLVTAFILWLVWFIFYMFYMKDYFWLFSNNNAQQLSTQINIEQRNNCENAVLAQLKSPWSAKFWDQRTTIFGGIKNYVDSQNWFWALLRSKFACQFSLKDNSVQNVVFDSEDINLHNLYKVIAGE